MRLGPVGFEHLAEFSGNTTDPQPGAAKCAATGARNEDFGSRRPYLDDPELATIIDAWPTLPETIRRGIVAMVESAKG
jgi:hypothetical protein